jgi:hypothetical protein
LWGVVCHFSRSAGPENLFENGKKSQFFFSTVLPDVEGTLMPFEKISIAWPFSDFRRRTAELSLIVSQKSQTIDDVITGRQSIIIIPYFFGGIGMISSCQTVCFCVMKMDNVDLMGKFRQLMDRDDPDFVAQLAAVIKSDLVDYAHKHHLDVTIDNIPPLISPFSMRDNVFKVESFVDVNDSVAKIDKFAERKEIDKSLFRQCFTSAAAMELANAEVFEKVDATVERKTVFVFPPLMLRHMRPEMDVLVFKHKPSDPTPTAMLLFLKMGAVIPVAFDVVAFKALLARYHFYSLENMNADEVRAYLGAQ